MVALDRGREALFERGKEIELCNLALKQSMTNTALSDKKVMERDDQLGAWYRNPFVVITLGAIIGGIATGIAIKK